MTNNRLDEIRHKLNNGEELLRSDTAYLISLLDARPAVAGDARAVAEKAVNQIAVGAWQFCSRQWAIEMFTEAITAHANQRYREGVEAIAIIVRQRQAYIESKDMRNGWSRNESGPCCENCAMCGEHFTGHADALKALAGCRNPFQLAEVCQCHIPTRQAVKNGVLAILNQIETARAALLQESE